LGQRFRASSISNLVSLGLRCEAHEGVDDITLTSAGSSAKGAWVQLFASLALKTNYLTIHFDNNNTANEYHTDIGTGAAASEVVLVPDLEYEVSVAGNNRLSLVYPLKVNIAAGTRLSARTAATDVTDTIQIGVIATG